MGWSYRRSMNFGPFRMNLSNSGVGYSVGGRGFRTGVTARGRRYSSVSIPGTGLRYYQQHNARPSGCFGVLAGVVIAAAGGVWLFTVLLRRL